MWVLAAALSKTRRRWSHDLCESASESMQNRNSRVIVGGMALGQNPTRRIQITLSTRTHDYLAALARRGTHGSNIVDVARTLVEQGVRDAIRENFITIDDGGTGQKGSE
jgi:hypothetical protein